MPKLKIRNQVLLIESELDNILGEYPHILRPALKTLLLETQNEYVQLQNSLLTEREKTQTTLHNTSQNLVKSTSASTQMLFSAMAQNIIHFATTLDPSAIEKDKQEANKLKETKKKEMIALHVKLNETIAKNTQLQIQMNFSPNHSLLNNLTALCCGYSKEAIIWYNLDIKIKLWKKIDANLKQLGIPEPENTDKQTTEVNDTNHKPNGVVTNTNGIHSAQSLSHRSRSPNDCKINY